MATGDYAKTFFDFWKAQTEVFVQAQEQAGRAMADGMQAMAAGKFPSFADGDLAKAGKAMTELWDAANSLSAALLAKLPASRGSDTVDSTFRHMLDPQSWMGGGGEIDDVLGRMAEGPRFADLWDMERRYARVMHAWATTRRCSLEHNAVVVQAWMRAGTAFARAHTERTSGDKPPPDNQELLAMWAQIANTELIETQRSEDFLSTQSAMIRASTALRLAQQDLVEHAGKQYGFPTRTELDDVHRTLTELRREVRTLRRAARTAPATLPASAPELAPAPQAARPARRRAAAANGGGRHDANRH
jgi:hypothetical protein